MTSAAFSPDGSRLVTTSSDGTARIWDVAARRSLVILRGHDDLVSSADLSPDGRFVVTGSWDGSASVRESSSGALVETLRGTQSFVMDVAFALDGSRVATAGFDGTLRMHTCELCGSLDDLLSLARRRVQRERTAAERAKYLHED